jgi:biopolymer transport protein ExbD
MLKKSKRRISIYIDMTPLVDVIILLLIFFFMTARFSEPEEIEVRLPETKSGVNLMADVEQIVILIPDKDHPFSRAKDAMGNELEQPKRGHEEFAMARILCGQLTPPRLAFEVYVSNNPSLVISPWPANVVTDLTIANDPEGTNKLIDTWKKYNFFDGKVDNPDGTTTDAGVLAIKTSMAQQGIFPSYIVRCDDGATFGILREIMKELQAAAINKFTVLTMKKEGYY